MAEINFIADEDVEDEINFAPAPVVAANPKPIIPPSFVSHLDDTDPGLIGAGPQLTLPPELNRVVNRRGLKPDIMAPLLPISRLAPSAQTVAEALDVLASSSPDLTQQESEELLLRQSKPDTTAKVIAGVHGSVLRGLEGATSLPMLATLGLAAAPAAVGRVASGGFAADMLRHVPESSQRLGQAVEGGDPEEIASAATDLAQLGVFTTAAGSHAVAPRRPVVLPETMRELAKEPAAPAVAPKAEAPVAEPALAPAEVATEPKAAPVAEASKAVEPSEVTIKARTPAGEEISLKMEAGEAQRRFTQRKTVLESLRDCMG